MGEGRLANRRPGGGVIRVGELEWDTTPKWVGVSCDWDGCGQEAKAFGFCKKHYQNAMYSSRHEHLIPEAHRKERCSIPECDEPRYARGLCRNHTTKARNGTLDYQAKKYREEMEEPGDRNTVSGRIKNARISMGWTRRELAQRLGIEEEEVSHTVTRVERMEGKPQGRVIRQYAAALGVGISSLYPPHELPDPSIGTGSRMTRERMLRGWSLEDVASRFGVSRERIRQVESQNIISDRWAVRLTQLYGLTDIRTERCPHCEGSGKRQV